MSAEFLTVYEKMDRQEEHHSDGDAAVEDQNDGKLIQDHAKQAGGEGQQDQPQQQPAFRAQLPAVYNGMDDAEQQKQHGCHFVNVDTGEGHHNGYDEADKKCEIE